MKNKKAKEYLVASATYQNAALDYLVAMSQTNRTGNPTPPPPPPPPPDDD